MRTWYHNLDYWSLLTWLALVAFGLLAIYSATQGEAHHYLKASVKNNFNRQLVWLCLAVVAMAVTLVISVRQYMDLAFVSYVACIGLLIAALLFGREVGGARSWLYLGPYGFQTSELAKLGAIIAIARLFSARRASSSLLFSVAAAGLLLLPAVLIILQNDAGTALVFFGLIPFVLFWIGTTPWLIILLITPAIISYLSVLSPKHEWPLAAIGFSIVLTLLLYMAYRNKRLAAACAVISGGTIAAVSFALEKVLKPHHVARILAFANPEADEFKSGVGFHLMQSKAAIGSGGLSGKGFMQGTQTQGSYIPEQSTDFIFSVIGEELGFLGAILLLTLFAVLLIRITFLAKQINHPFGSMIAAGAAGIFLIQVCINVGMVLGLLPVIGIPLPLVSYGGSALLANSTLLAIVLNLHMRRKEFTLCI